MSDTALGRIDPAGKTAGAPRASVAALAAGAGLALPLVERLTPPAGTPLLLGQLDPAGWIVVALPGDAQASGMADALTRQGFSVQDVRQLGAAEMSAWLRSLLFEAGMADQVRDLRDFYIQALEGCAWLMVRAGDPQAELRVGEEATRAGARSITKYEPAGVTRH